jgi:hypothetical protein
MNRKDVGAVQASNYSTRDLYGYRLEPGLLTVTDRQSEFFKHPCCAGSRTTTYARSGLQMMNVASFSRKMSDLYWMLFAGMAVPVLCYSKFNMGF